MTDSPIVPVFGSFGFGNVGDELVPTCLARLSLACGVPLTTQPISRFGSGKLDGVLYLRAEDEPHLRGAFQKKIILCGGGIIEPREKSCLNRLVETGRRLGGAEFMPFAISTDHATSYSWKQRRRIRRALAHLSEVFVRDDLSNEALRRILPGTPITTVGDIALWLSAEEPPTGVYRNPDRPYLAVTLGDRWASDAFISFMAGELARTVDRLGLTIDIIPISNTVGVDVDIHRRLQTCLHERHGIEARLSLFAGAEVLKPGWIAHAYANAAVVVGMRLHACVMAYSQRTPFVALAYHPKVAGFCKTVGWTNFVLPRRLPERQDEGEYGYRFETINLADGELVEKITAAIRFGDFSALDYYRHRQKMIWPSVLEWLSEG